MREFRVGDLVEFSGMSIISNWPEKYELKQGKIYIIEDLNLGNSITKLKGIPYQFESKIFKLRLDLIREEKLKQLLN